VDCYRYLRIARPPGHFYHRCPPQNVKFIAPKTGQKIRRFYFLSICYQEEGLMQQHPPLAAAEGHPPVV